MGLLDQVLGQVIGNMAGGGQGRPGGSPQAGGGMGGMGGMGDILGQILAGGGRGQPGQAPGGGGGIGDILGQVLGGGQGGQGAPQTQAPGGGGGPLGGALGSILGGAGGKLSPLLLAVLAVLASKNLSSGAGGLGTILHDMMGGGRQPSGGDPGGEAAPEGYEGGGPGGPQQAGGDYEDAYGEPPAGAPPYPGPQGDAGGRMADRGGGGGFLNDIGSMLDGPGGSRQAGVGGGGLGGFDDLQRQFEQNGQGGLMDSWVGQGANREAAPGDLEQALGSGTIDQLAQQFGIDRNELLQQLSKALPQVVDGLTPNGRAPTEQEQRGWV